MLKLLVPKFRPDSATHLKDIAIAENQVPAKLKPIVNMFLMSLWSVSGRLAMYYATNVPFRSVAKGAFGAKE